MLLPYASGTVRDAFDDWLADVVARHGEQLTFTEIRKGVQALSTLYVERHREGRLAARSVDGLGKRAGLATYYAALHFLTTIHAVEMVGDELAAPARILDLGCGTGAVGAAAALGLGGAAPPRIVGIDRSGWALDEARKTWESFGLLGQTERTDLPHGMPKPVRGDLVCCGWFLSELGEDERQTMLRRFRSAIRRGVQLLILEPLSTKTSPWWAEWAASLTGGGIRDELVRVAIKRPRFIADMDKAAHLDHQLIGARVFVGPAVAPKDV